MRSLLVLITLAFSLNSFSYECPDKNLSERGFEILDNSKFEKMKKRILPWSESADFEFDLDGTYYSLNFKEWYTLVSLDNTKTQRDEMFGDVVIIRRHDTNEVTEIRWYKNGKKYLVHSDYQPCAQNLVPLAENALF